MNLHLQDAVLVEVKLATGHHILLGEDVIEHLLFAYWNLGVLIAQENRRLCVFFSVDCQDIKTSLAELLVVFVEDQSILEIAAITERVKINIIFFNQLKDAIRSGFVEVKLHLPVFMQRDDLERLLRQMLEGIKLRLIFH